MGPDPDAVMSTIFDLNNIGIFYPARLQEVVTTSRGTVGVHTTMFTKLFQNLLYTMPITELFNNKRNRTGIK